MNNSKKIKLFKWLKLTSSLTIIVLIFICSWLKSPDLGKNLLLPSWLNNWSNIHGQIRTAVPFIPLGFILNTFKKKWIINLLGLLICFLVGCIAEIGQLFIPTRVFDIVDIFFGIIGSLCGMVLQNIFKKIETKV